MNGQIGRPSKPLSMRFSLENRFVPTVSQRLPP